MPLCLRTNSLTRPGTRPGAGSTGESPRGLPVGTQAEPEATTVVVPSASGTIWERAQGPGGATTGPASGPDNLNPIAEGGSEEAALLQVAGQRHTMSCRSSCPHTQKYTTLLRAQVQPGAHRRDADADRLLPRRRGGRPRQVSSQREIMV